MKITQISTLMRHEAITHNALCLAKQAGDLEGVKETRQRLRAVRRRLNKSLHDARHEQIRLESGIGKF